jgi:D-glycero-alpha-D-manno-heptose-7-phosphate kinase
MGNAHDSRLIVTRTPLRVSFSGGGTDLPEYFKAEQGAVLGTAINKYVYITVKKHGELFDEPIRLNYSETELVRSVDEIQNAIARECLKLLKVDPPIYISTVGDLPAASGLGSSSSFAVGLLNALHAYRGERVSAGQLAEEGAHVELDVLKRPMGKQDHYFAAFGGLNLLRFLTDGGVSVEPQRFPDDSLDKLFAHLMLFFTSMTRNSSSVLGEQQKNTSKRMNELRLMCESALSLKDHLMRGFEPVKFGKHLEDTWMIKREMASGISNQKINDWYDRAKNAGALGGKLCGAGGGGFMLFVVPPEKQSVIRTTLHDLKEVSINHESQGSCVLSHV